MGRSRNKVIVRERAVGERNNHKFFCFFISFVGMKQFLAPAKTGLCINTSLGTSALQIYFIYRAKGRGFNTSNGNYSSVVEYLIVIQKVMGSIPINYL